MLDEQDKLEVVFYSSPVPLDLTTLTVLGLVFDRVHFPNVYMPSEGFDREKVLAEIARIEALNLKDFETWMLVEIMKYALTPEVREFCYFTGESGQVFGGRELKDAKELVGALYEQVYGPPRADFIPTFNTGHYKGLSDSESINWPGAFYYQSNALLYSARNGIPLLNADPTLPVPAVPSSDPRRDVSLLTTIMALECVSLVLPKVASLQPRQIVEARQELSKELRPFRVALLRLAGRLASAIDSDATAEDIHAAAAFLAKTEVYPSLLELKAAIEKPHKGWKQRSWDLIKKTPEIATAYASFDLARAIPKTVNALGDWLVSGFSEQRPRSDLYYLLSLSERLK